MKHFLRTSCIVAISIITLPSCQKTDFGKTSVQNEVVENPLLRRDLTFPNGVLQFASTASFKEFYKRVEKILTMHTV